MNTVVPPDFDIESPCTKCLVRVTCKAFCVEWINFCHKNFPHDIKIPLKDFAKQIDICGPMDNEFLKFYNIIAVEFHSDDPNSFNIEVNNLKSEDIC